MSNTRKVLLAIAGFYVLGLILLGVIFGVSSHKNNAFQIQNEFKLINWIDLGVLSINRAVLYLFLSAIATIGTMVWIAGRICMRREMYTMLPTVSTEEMNRYSTPRLMLSGPRFTQFVSLNSFWIWNSLFLCPLTPRIAASRISPST